jgi:hypothetical protein
MSDQFEDEGLQRLRDAWEASQRGESLAPSKPDLRDELADLKTRLEALELKVSRIPGRVFDHLRR